MIKYKLKVNFLTPVHIGGEKDIEGYEYVIAGDLLHYINLPELLLSLGKDQQDEFIKDLRNNINNCRETIKKHYANFIFFSIPVSEDAKAFYNSKFNQDVNQLIMSPFISSNNRSFIPGSSIKGAIRTGFVVGTIDTNKHKFKNNGKDKKGQLFEAEVLECQRYNNKEKTYYGHDPQTDPFRAVLISDGFLPVNSTMISKVNNYNYDKKTPITEQLYEVTKSQLSNSSDLSITFELNINDLLLNNFVKIKNKIGIDDIVNKNRKFYGNLIKNELEFYPKNSSIKSTYEKLDEINSKLKEKEFLCNIGFGGGFNSKVIRAEYIKTRKNIETKYPLGWIIAEVIES